MQLAVQIPARVSTVGRCLFLAIGLSLFALPAALADIVDRRPKIGLRLAESTQAVPLAGADRMGGDPAGAAAGLMGNLLQPSGTMTVVVEMPSNWLNSTERRSIFDKITEKYTFASTMMTFTTVRPTTGSYHVVTIQTGDDPDNAAFGWGPGPTTASVYGGRFTVRRSTWFSSTSSRVNAIGETAAHELDHLLRGGGHTSGLNEDGSGVSYTARANDQREFPEADKEQKKRNMAAGTTFKDEDAGPGPGQVIQFIYAHDPEAIVGDPDDLGVSFVAHFLQDPGPFTFGIMPADGQAWTFADGLNPPGMYSTALDAGTMVDFALINRNTQQAYPFRQYGVYFQVYQSIMPDPSWYMKPQTTEPYASQALLRWDADGFIVDMVLYTTHPPQGFRLAHLDPSGVEEAVAVQNFHAAGEPGSVLVSWTVASAAPFTGFRIQRSEEMLRGYEVLNKEPIAFRPSVADEYSIVTYRDVTAPEGRLMHYRLEAKLAGGGWLALPDIASATALAPIAAAGLDLRLASPSPAQDHAVFSLHVPGGPADVSLAVYDLGGRRVATLFEGTLPGGTHTRAWDLRDDAGARVAVGVYFVRLQSGENVRTVSLVVLK